MKPPLDYINAAGNAVQIAIESVIRMKYIAEHGCAVDEIDKAAAKVTAALKAATDFVAGARLAARE